MNYSQLWKMQQKLQKHKLQEKSIAGLSVRLFFSYADLFNLQEVRKCQIIVILMAE